MTALEDKVENALNETRMLILGAQVLLGFGFQSTFQPVYERLPSSVQEVKVVSLTLMLLAVGLSPSHCPRPTWRSVSTLA